MPATKRPENPLDVLRVLEQRVRILEQARRLPSLIGAHVTKNSNQIVSSTMVTLTQVTFALPVDFDTDGYFDDATDQFIVPQDLDGYYYFYANTEWVNGTGEVRSRFRYNGSGYIENIIESAGGGVVETSQLISATKFLSEGDTIQLAVSHNQGTNRSVVGTGDNLGTYMGIRLVGK